MADNKQVFGFLEYNKFYIERLSKNPEFSEARIDLE